MPLAHDRDRTLQAVILDVDGTLVDSNDAHARAWCDAFHALGFRAALPVVRGLIGMGGDKLIPRVTGLGADTRAGKEVARLRGAIFLDDYLEDVRAFRGSRRLVEVLLERGLRVAIASSSELRERDALLEIAGVAELLRRSESSTDAEKSKPDPDVVHAGLARRRVAKARVLLVGDTPYDVQAAAIAGVRTIALRCGGWDDDELAGALAIHDGPWALARVLERQGKSLRSPRRRLRSPAGRGSRRASRRSRSGAPR
jgi:phosphoglycolate phosphatase-like HAD superfamily hydrolase